MSDDKKEKLISPRYSTSNGSATNGNNEMSNDSNDADNETAIDVSEDKPRETLQIINRIKEITQRMMAYAIKNPNIDLSEELLSKIVPVLRKDSRDFDDDDEIALWSSYNALTEIIKPATNFSLIIANQLNEEMGGNSKQVLGSLKFWSKPESPMSSAVEKCHKELRTIFFYLITSVILYVLVQGYSGLLSDSLTDMTRHIEEWKTQKEMLAHDNLEEKELALANEHLEFLAFQLDSSVEFLIDLTKPILLLSNNDNAKANCEDFMDQKTVSTRQVIVSCITFQKQYTSSALMVLSQYILPLILGTLGATAFIVRNTLEKLQTDSYLPSANGKLSMRLCLGGLLGVISGIFLSTASAEELASFNINLVMVSLIMGYSVEVAFSLFDSVVSRMRDWTDSLKK